MIFKIIKIALFIMALPFIGFIVYLLLLPGLLFLVHIFCKESIEINENKIEGEE